MKAARRRSWSGGASIVLMLAVAAVLLWSRDEEHATRSRTLSLPPNEVQAPPPASITLPPPPKVTLAVIPAAPPMDAPAPAALVRAPVRAPVPAPASVSVPVQAGPPKIETAQSASPPTQFTPTPPTPPTPPTSGRSAPPPVPPTSLSPPAPSPPGPKPSVTLKAGRVLLRQLEAGQGPSIEIAWPSSRAERDALYSVFVRCYGMTTAILDDEGRVFRAEGPAGRPWRLNPDRYSGFLRQAAGDVVIAERRALATIRARHGLRTGTPIRLFPRRVDAALLGGLHQKIGASFVDGATIHARYRQTGSHVRVTALYSNGRATPGDIVLRPVCNN